MEKPFGTDLASAQALNGAVHEVFEEQQIFRIDHFLGKEAAEHPRASVRERPVRADLEPQPHRSHPDRRPRDARGRRSRRLLRRDGAFRDMVVTHLFQVLAFVAMEPPTALAPMAIAEKVKVFRSLGPLDRSRRTGAVRGYRSEDGVDRNSQTETFIALECQIDNWRWSGVPFYLRTGKRMAEVRGSSRSRSASRRRACSRRARYR